MAAAPDPLMTTVEVAVAQAPASTVAEGNLILLPLPVYFLMLRFVMVSQNPMVGNLQWPCHGLKVECQRCSSPPPRVILVVTVARPLQKEAGTLATSICSHVREPRVKVVVECRFCCPV